MLHRIPPHHTGLYLLSTVLFFGLCLIAPPVAWRAAVIVGVVEGARKVGRRLRGRRGRPG